MPFAGYDSFSSCVTANQDKDSPEGFCAWLEHKTTGKWPGEMTQGLPSDVVGKFWLAFDSYMIKEKNEKAALEFARQAVAQTGWVVKRQGWMHQANHKMETRAVFGVPIFAVGTHNGDKYSIDDLNGMVTAFKDLSGRLDPPVKIGHTSDEFNKNLAEKMGIAPEFIKGEAGNGVMAFGWVENLRISGDTMYADLTDVPEPVADLIESKGYKQVSAEVLFNFEDKGKTYPKVLAGLALLGSELPAVRETGLESAAVYMMGIKPDSVIEFETKGGERMEDVKTGLARLWSEFQSKAAQLFSGSEELGIKPNKKEEEVMNKEVLKLLGLDEKAKDEDVVAAVKKLQGEDMLAAMVSLLGLPEGATMEDVMAAVKQLMSGAQAAPAEMKKFTDRMVVLEKDNKALKRAGRVAHYKELAGELKAISGTPDELAEELVSIEEKAGEDTVNKLLGRYQEQNRRLIAAGLFKAKGTPAEGNDEDEHAFTKEVNAYMKDKQVDEPTAQAALRKSKPALFKDFMKTRRIETPADK